MLVTNFQAQAFATNCWILATGRGQECVVVDPGMPNVSEQLAEKLKEFDLKPVVDPRRCVICLALKDQTDLLVLAHPEGLRRKIPAEGQLIAIRSGNHGEQNSDTHQDNFEVILCQNCRD